MLVVAVTNNLHFILTFKFTVTKLRLGVPCIYCTYVDAECAESNLTSSAGSTIQVTIRSYSLLFPNDNGKINNNQRIQLRLVQSDHRGGFCDCWGVSSLKLSLAESITIGIPLK